MPLGVDRQLLRYYFAVRLADRRPHAMIVLDSSTIDGANLRQGLEMPVAEVAA